MFHHLSGKIIEIEPNFTAIDCHGIGFALNISANTSSRLKKGDIGTLYVYESVREDAFDLYGFFDKSERRSFEMLIGVSGVGPKAAISILSSSTPEGLAMAVISGDEKSLTIAQGIGKKIAQRILLELKDKMSKETANFAGGFTPTSGTAFGNSKLSDAISALAVLGYASAEIGVAIKGIDVENTALEDVIRLALKKMIK